jgi:hypothetical protein
LGTFKGGLGSAARDVAMSGPQIAEGEDWFERFAEMLAVMGFEELIRFRHRLGKRGCERTARILTLEIVRRKE